MNNFLVLGSSVILTRKLTVVYLFLTTTEGNIAEEVMEEFMSAEGKDFMKLKGYPWLPLKALGIGDYLGLL